MKTLVSAAFLVAVVVVAGCTEDATGNKVKLDEPASPATSSTATATPEKATVPEPVDDKMLRGRNVADTEMEKQVADVWYAYWTELVRMYNTAEMDRDRLAELARGDAFEGPAGYVDELRQRKQHNVGGLIAAVTKVSVDGTTADVWSCFRNTMIAVDEAGVPVEAPLVFMETHEVLKKEGPNWRVTSHDVTSRNQACDFQ